MDTLISTDNDGDVNMSIDIPDDEQHHPSHARNSFADDTRSDDEIHRNDSATGYHEGL